MSSSALVRGHGLRTGGRVRAYRRGALLGALCLAIAAPTARAQTPVGNLFTYQGRLMDAGSPANGTYDFRFQLYDAPVGGTQVGPTLPLDDWFVSTGLFTVPLNFGSVFNGQNRFLEVAVRPGASTGSYETVSGRHTLTPTPMALVGLTAPWAGVTSKPPGFADDVDNDLVGGLVCATGQVVKAGATSPWTCGIDNDTNTTYTAPFAGGLILTGTAFSIADGGVTTARLAVDAVTNAKLADASVGPFELQDGAVGITKLLDLAVTNPKLGNASVGTTKLADAAVTGAKIAPSTIGSAHIMAGSISSGHIIDNAVSASEIVDGSVGSAELGDGSVGSAEIALSAVGSAEIADGAVARADIGGTEVALYQGTSDCGSTALTLSPTCFTTVCAPGPPQVLFFTCAGACAATAPQSCPTTLRGYLLGTAIP